jgi:hypothetical protein
MDVPIGFDDRVDTEQTVLATFLDQRGNRIAQPVAIDAAIHHDMRDMKTERPVLTRHALRDHAQSCLGGGKLRIARPAAQAGGRAGKDDRAAAEWGQSPHRLAADKKAAKAPDPPEILESLRGQRAEIDALIVAGIEDDKVGRLVPAPPGDIA